MSKPFFGGSERSRQSERLENAHYNESIIATGNVCFCGNCRRLVTLKHQPIICENANCQATWKQIILQTTATPIANAHLPMIGVDTVRSKQPYIDNDIHALGSRAVYTVLITNELL